MRFPRGMQDQTLRLALHVPSLILFSESMLRLSQIFFFLALVLSFTGMLSPPVALTAGILFGLSFPHPFASPSRNFAKFLLQASVVALGFGMNLQEVLKAGRTGFLYTALGIAFALCVGFALGKFLRVRGNSSFLITAGTAICGGSAIAAVGPILQADDEEMAVSLGTIFILNSVALLLFPAIGKALHLSQSQFGLWAALAIHDTSSVVGASAKYGAEALVIGTTVKLARALWIVPLALATAGFTRTKFFKHTAPSDLVISRTGRGALQTVRDGLTAEGDALRTAHGAAQPDAAAEETVRSTPIPLPWFILFFVLAAVFNTYVPAFAKASASLFTAGRLGLTATLFLIGTGISRTTLEEVGWRPLLQGILLWMAVGLMSLYFIRTGFIAF